MIYSSIYANDDVKKYPVVIQRALDYIKTTDLVALAPGEYLIEGKEMYAKVFDSTTKPATEIRPEYHNDYIDVQYVVTGCELMGICPKKGEYEIVSKIEAEDVYLLGKVEGEQFIKLVPGDYCILFPNDIHRPGTCEGEPQTYRKCVVKIAISLL